MATETADEVKLVNARLGPADHRLLRLIAADRGTSMTQLATEFLLAVLRTEAERIGIKP